MRGGRVTCRPYPSRSSVPNTSDISKSSLFVVDVALVGVRGESEGKVLNAGEHDTLRYPGVHEGYI